MVSQRSGNKQKKKNIHALKTFWNPLRIFNSNVEFNFTTPQEKEI